MEVKTLKNAIRKAKRAYENGVRYYDQKHNTYNPADYPENILAHVSDIVGYHGIESYEPGDNNPTDPQFRYVNSGDSYGTTVIYNSRTGQFRIGDIGTIIETTSREETK